MKSIPIQFQEKIKTGQRLTHDTVKIRVTFRFKIQIK